MPADPQPHVGFIFDLDGTLVDNMVVHREAFQRFAANHGLPTLSDAIWRQLDGKRNRDIFPVLFERDLSRDELRHFSGEKESLYRQLANGRLRPLAGLHRLLHRLEARDLPVAIATSAPSDNVDYTLSALALVGRFSVVIRSDQVERGKPHPDVFLAAAAGLGVPPDGCVGFEDAPAGIDAVLAAGMTCVGLTTTMSRDNLTAHGRTPHHVVADFVEYLDGPGRWLASDRPLSAPTGG
jgi:beta-phosphoglucomutase